MSAEQNLREQIVAIADRLHYATTVVVIGTDPDDPGSVVMDMLGIPVDRPICLARQAEMLRDAAQSLDERHREYPC
ncbi:hypothetical protein AXA44_02795 [Rhodococcus sp. SC4]|nr:hypothetical protein AXA44_02795 [Rhodococcus sp. SC4]